MKRKQKKRGNHWMAAVVFLFVTGVLWWGASKSNSFAASAPGTPQGLLANGVGEKIVISWEPVKGADGYEIYEKMKGQDSWSMVKAAAGRKIVLKNRRRGKRYSYKIRAYKVKSGKIRYGRFSKKSVTVLPEEGTSTIRNFLNTALKPVGSTMYIWGGGWNKGDTGAGADALRIGLNPRWRSFAGLQKKSYRYRNYRYKRGYGLDCSGFVGWAIYNIFHTAKGAPGEGYVDKAANLAGNYAKKGWGTYKKAAEVKNYKAGDIMSGPGHVYIVLGACGDGSVILVHSSPAGVQISGTVSRSGAKDSQAIRLAKKYMKKYYPSWYKRFPDCSRDSSYLTKYDQFRWNTGKGSVMEDTEGYRNKTGKAILRDLFK